MKPEWNKSYTTIAVYAFIVIAAAIIFANVLSYIQWFLSGLGQVIRYLMPVVYALAFAYVLNPLMMFGERNMDYLLRCFQWQKAPKHPTCLFIFLLFFEAGEKGVALKRDFKRFLAILGSYIIALVILVLLFAIVIPQLVNSATVLINNIPQYSEQVNFWMAEIEDRFPEAGDFIKDQMGAASDELEKMLYDIVAKLTNLAGIYSVTMQVTTKLLHIVIGFIITIYLLFNKETFFAQGRKISYALLKKENAQKVMDVCKRSNDIFSGFLLGKILDSFIIGVICFICMMLMNMPYTLLISVIIGVTNIIPYVGPFIGAIPSIFIIFIISPMQSLWFAIFILILQQVDGNIIGPKILGKSTGLKAFWVIVALLIFGGWLGILGMVIGVPLFAIFYVFLKDYIEKRLEEKGFMPHTESWQADLDAFDKTEDPNA